ncbi:MAG: SEL1-like repeat protein [Bauldia sp.]|nr:SEL1-like repeat protein [Bauldia sp.]
MKTGKSWGIRDIDARTREIAEAAARRAGITPEAWLADAIARVAGERREPADDDGGIAAALAALGEQVRSMTDDVRAAGDTPAEPDLDAMIERLARELQDVDETARTTVEGLGRHAAPQRAGGDLEDVLRSLEAQVAAVARRGRDKPVAEPPRSSVGYDDIRDRMAALLAHVPEPPRRHAPPPSRDMDFDQVIRDLEARVSRLDRAPPPRGAPPSTPLSRDEDARVRRIRARLAEIGDRLAEAASPEPPPRRPPPEPDPLAAAIADIARRQSTLSDRHIAVAADASPAAIGALRAEVVVLSDRIGALVEQSRDERAGIAGRIDRIAETGRASAATVAAALGDIGKALDALAARRSGADTAQVAALASGLAELRGKVDGLERHGRESGESLRRVEARLEDIARADPTPLIRNLEARIDGLVARIDAAVNDPAGATALDALRAEIGSVRSEIAVRDAASMETLESRIRGLAEEVTASVRSEGDGDQLAALESRVESLAEELARTTPRARALEDVEENLVRLQASLIEGRRDSIEAARAAARNAVRELGATGADRELVAALRDDLDEIRRLIGAAERPEEDSDASMRETLAAVAARISQLTEAAEASEAAMTPETPDVPAASPPAEPAYAPEPAIPRAAPRTRPDLAAIRELAGAAPAAERAIHGRRADFIAAARRAAQTAVAEADAGTGVGIGDRLVGADAEHSPFARIGQAIRARRKTLVLAAAAIVIALGALQIGSRPVDVAEVAPAPAEDQPGAIIIHRPAGSLAPPQRVASGGSVPPFAMPEAGDVRLVPPATDARSAMDLATPDPVVTGSTPAADDPSVGPEKLRLAAAAGDAAAAYEIASRYAEGRGTIRDLSRAAAWYGRAADAGLAPAQYRLGSLYERGQGVARDTAKAVDLYRRAAEQGNAGAMHNLAVLISNGAAGSPDPAGALRWFQAAADFGVKDSQYNLGVIYGRGLGTAVDVAESYKWFAIAAAGGDKDASARRDEVAAMLDQNQLALARAKVQTWRPQAPAAAANEVVGPPGGWGDHPAGLTAQDQKALVQKIQTLLASKGYDPGPADGVEGPKTRQAVRAFQASVGLVDTGLIDRSLVAALAQRAG